MNARIMTQAKRVSSLTYNFAERKVYAGETVFSNVVELYFENDVECSGEANYADGYASIDFDYPVTLTAEQYEDGILVSIRQSTRRKGRQSLIQAIVERKPKVILGKLVKWEKSPEEVSNIGTVQYDAKTETAHAYGAESATFENILFISFPNLGEDSKISPDWAELNARHGFVFRVKQFGDGLEIEEEPE